MLRTEWTFRGVTYGFTYAVTREWARWYLRDREGVKVYCSIKWRLPMAVKTEDLRRVFEYANNLSAVDPERMVWMRAAKDFLDQRRKREVVTLEVLKKELEALRNYTKVDNRPPKKVRRWHVMLIKLHEHMIKHVKVEES